MKDFVKLVGLVLLFSVAGSFAAENTLACPEGTVISSISYEGLEHTKNRVVDRELLNKVGEPYSAEKFDLEKRRLQDLDLFTSVSARCEGGNLTYSFVEIFRWIPAPAGKTTDRDGLMLGVALARISVAFSFSQRICATLRASYLGW